MDIVGHGDVDVAFHVVPFEGEATVEGAIPVDGGFVGGFDGIDKVEGIWFAEVFDAKVIDT